MDSNLFTLAEQLSKTLTRSQYKRLKVDGKPTNYLAYHDRGGGRYVLCEDHSEFNFDMFISLRGGIKCIARQVG